MAWIRVLFTIPEGGHDIALAMLSEYPFSAYAEEDGGLAGYIEEKDWTIALREALVVQNGEYWKGFSDHQMPDVNWNKQWETHFEPVIIPPFCGIRALFHPEIQNVQYEIVIQPEMAFGTGHHATTQLMIEGMSTMDFAGKKVLDFGSGTAVLAILAARMGAHTADAIEIEGPACESSRLNVERNHVEGTVHVIEGDVTLIPRKDYDILLANINRNVLIHDLPTLDTHLGEGAKIGLSGFLDRDIADLTKSGTTLGWELTNKTQLADWVSLWWTKTSK
jgi:ribosomal protein L11 methyltransferase